MRHWPILLLVLLGRLGGAQTPDTAPRAPGTTVSGVVHDSIARMPLGGATVQLVAAGSVVSFSRTTAADAQGRFTFSDIRAGRYVLGFFHAMLDSLGLEPPLREVVVIGRRRVRADLAIPSPARMRAAICGPGSMPDSGGVILGIVRDARDGSPVAEATVTVEWLEFTLTRGTLVRRAPRRFATTMESGFFAVCDVPSPGAMALMASRGADSTDWIEVQAPPEGFLRRELYLGAARTAVVGDSTRLGELVPLWRRVHHGDGRLSGTVVTVAQGRPLPNALVSIIDGPETRTNERGEFTLVNAPSGTRTLLVRAVGYYPSQRSVDIVASAPPVRVALSTFKAVLDTIKVTARLVADRYRGFEARRRSAAGRYITAEEIARWRPINTSDIFRFVAGVRVVRRELETIVVLRGAIADTAFADTTLSAGTVCQPMMFLDGHNLFNIPLESVDDLVQPQEIAAIEVYMGGTVPPQYDDARTGCGAIIIWTK